MTGVESLNNELVSLRTSETSTKTNVISKYAAGYSKGRSSRESIYQFLST